MDILYKIFKWLAITSWIVGIISIIPCPEVFLALALPFPSAINKTTVYPLLCLFILGPSFTILMSVISFKTKTKTKVGKVFSAIFIIILCFPITIVGNMFWSRFQPQSFVSKPTVINQDNLPVYKACILYSRKYDDDKTLTIHNGYRVIVEGQFYMLKGNSFELNRAENALGKDRIEELELLCNNTYNIGCLRFQRHNDFLVFYKAAYTSKVNGPGIVYSLSGINPNEADYEILNECKPLVHIAGNWYTSKQLMLKGPRSNIHSSLRDSVFEDSLKIDKDIRELLKAEQW